MIGLAVAAMLLAAPVTKVDSVEDLRESCSDDDGRDLCDRVVQEKIRAALDAEPAESLASRGVEGVRVFMVNGYGNDQPMVSILWGPSMAPFIEVRIDRGEAVPDVLSFKAGDWNRRSTRTLMRLVREARPQPPKMYKRKLSNGEEELRLCMHAWMAVVESLERGRVYRRVRHGCDRDALFDGAMQFATVAVNASEACRAVRPENYRNDWGRIAACPAIVGPNVNGAAAVYELTYGDPLKTPTYPHEPTLDNLAPDVVWRTPGQTASGRDGVAAAWRAFAGDAEAGHWVRTVRGEGAVVQVEGIVNRFSDETSCSADSRQEWRRAQGRWRLVSWTLTDCVAQPKAG